MRVVTLFPEDFNIACAELSSKIKKSYSPDLVVGVLTGGGYVARNVMKAFDNETLYTEIKVQREGTEQKGKGLTKVVLRLLPTWALDILRMVESRCLEWKSQKTKSKRYGKVEFPKEINTFLERDTKKKVLLVDDAIDTGATLKLVKDYIEERYSGVDIKVAVITVTMRHPVIDADFALYNDRTLIRFPWSHDMKRK